MSQNWPLYVLFVIFLSSITPLGFAEGSETSNPVDATADNPSIQAPEAASAIDVPSYAEMTTEELVALVASLDNNIQDSLRQNAEKVIHLREVRQAAREHETIIALRIELEKMREKIEDAIDVLPEVAEAHKNYGQGQRQLLEIMNLRSVLNNIIGQKERDEDSTMAPLSVE